jgi:hypothetical protein
MEDEDGSLSLSQLEAWSRGKGAQIKPLLPTQVILETSTRLMKFSVGRECSNAVINARKKIVIVEYTSVSIKRLSPTLNKCRKP